MAQAIDIIPSEEWGPFVPNAAEKKRKYCTGQAAENQPLPAKKQAHDIAQVVGSTKDLPKEGSGNIRHCRPREQSPLFIPFSNAGKNLHVALATTR
jgi:hypothetical protein